MAASTDEILAHHLQCFSAGDVAGILADYGERSVLITPDGAVLRGPHAMRPLFEAFFAEFAKPGASFGGGAGRGVGGWRAPGRSSTTCSDPLPAATMPCELT